MFQKRTTLLVIVRLQDGLVYGSYTVYTPEGRMCMLNLTLTQ